jgi:hypothetical protein
LHEFFWGNFHTPPPEISNGPPLNSCGVWFPSLYLD